MGRDFIDAYEEYVWDVYGYIAYRTGSRLDAEDLTQTTFERAFRAWDRFDERKASLRTWLLAIARNALIDHARADRRDTQISVSGLEDETNPALPTHSGPEQTQLGLSADLEAALSRLSQREREVLAFRFGADLRGREIAELLGITVANVHQLLSRSLRKLRQELEAGEGSRAPQIEALDAET